MSVSTLLIVPVLAKLPRVSLSLAPARSTLAFEIAVAMVMSPSEFEAYLRKDIEKWGKVVRDANLKPQ